MELKVANADLMKFLCKNCQQSLSATEELHGVDLSCPNCGESLKVPLPELPEIELPTPSEERGNHETESGGYGRRCWFQKILQLPKITCLSILLGLLVVAVTMMLSGGGDKNAIDKISSPQLMASRMREAYLAAVSVIQQANYALPLAERKIRRPLTQKEYFSVVQMSLRDSLPKLKGIDVKGCPDEFVFLFKSFRKAVSDAAERPNLFTLVLTHQFLPTAAEKYGTDPYSENSGRDSERELRRKMIERGEYPLP